MEGANASSIFKQLTRGIKLNKIRFNKELTKLGVSIYRVGLTLKNVSYILF